MNGFVKFLTGILGVMAVVACIATVGIIGYSFVNGGEGGSGAPKAAVSKTPDAVNVTTLPAPTDSSSDETPSPTGSTVPAGHVHDYKPYTIRQATCYESGQIKYECSCGDYYLVDIMSTGHVAGDWETVKEPTDKEDGKRVQRCIYCDEIVASEILPAKNSSKDPNASPTPYKEVLYVSTTEREPTCTLAGLRKITGDDGSFYTESIPAIGHVASDWEVADEPTSTHYGTAQRVCKVCGALLDTKSLPPLTPSPAPTPSASAGASSTARPTGSASGSSSPSASPTPSPTPHVHQYNSYVVTPATCTQKGVRSYICSCGSSYAESIELDLNNHSFVATFVPPTETQQGYTIYTCKRCNFSYKDNYIMPLTNTGQNSDDATKTN